MEIVKKISQPEENSFKYSLNITPNNYLMVVRTYPLKQGTMTDPFALLDDLIISLATLKGTKAISQAGAEYLKSGLSKNPIVSVTTSILGYAASAGIEYLATSEGTDQYLDILKKVAQEAEDGAMGRVDGPPLYTWVLPLPNSLQDALKHVTETTVIPIGARLLKRFPSILLNKLLSGPGVHDPGTVGTGSKKSALKQSILQDVKSAPKSLLEKAIELNIELAKRNNVAIDPNVINVYKETEPRVFSFSINLVPENNDRFKEILSAIFAFKKYMTGEMTKDSLLLQQKNIFTIEFYDTKLEEYIQLNNFIELNLLKIDIKIGSDGNMMLFENGVPKMINLTLIFQERRPMTLVETTSGDITNRGEDTSAYNDKKSSTVPENSDSQGNVTQAYEAPDSSSTQITPPDDNSDLEDKYLTQSAKEGIIEERAFNKSR
jgi:hypothetical protein